jgi:hypothetical protein
MRSGRRVSEYVSVLNESFHKNARGIEFDAYGIYVPSS